MFLSHFAKNTHLFGPKMDFFTRFFALTIIICPCFFLLFLPSSNSFGVFSHSKGFGAELLFGLSMVLWGGSVLDCPKGSAEASTKVPRKVPPRFSKFRGVSGSLGLPKSSRVIMSHPHLLAENDPSCRCCWGIRPRLVLWNRAEASASTRQPSWATSRHCGTSSVSIRRACTKKIVGAAASNCFCSRGGRCRCQHSEVWYSYTRNLDYFSMMVYS